jgi:hypothetical protein
MALGSFQKMVLFSAVIILMLALVLIGGALKYTNAKNWPPIIPDCPDYWTIDGSGNDTTCKNVKDLGKNTGACGPIDGNTHTIMNFNSAPFTGDNGIKAKYDWARHCGVSWDGITYGVPKPE